MVKNKGKRSLIIAISIAGILLIAIATVLIVRSLGSPDKDPYIQNNSTDSSEQSTTTSDEDKSKDESATSSNGTNTETEEPSTVDPATVSTIDISPLNITVSYVKGVGGFEYEVLRAQNGTRYVQFSSPELVGTKCTNDTGAFTSILVSPTAGESTTLTKTTKVDDTEYGLSLADATCTSDTAKLQKYQQSFSDGFTLLKKLN